MYDSPYLYGRESSQYFWVDGKKVNTAKRLNEYIGKNKLNLYTNDYIRMYYKI